MTLLRQLARPWRLVTALVCVALIPACGETGDSAGRNVAWIQLHITPGISRATAYSRLKSHGFVAFNWSYINGHMITPNPQSSITLDGCDWQDRSSGEWPYKDEPYPKGPCAGNGPPAKWTPDPDAVVEFDYYSPILCTTTVYATIIFSENDRVSAVQVGTPEHICT